MNKLDKLIKQAEKKAKFYPRENYDFNKLSIEELKELTYGEPTEQRLVELVNKMR